jgi:hypothetical protein
LIKEYSETLIENNIWSLWASLGLTKKFKGGSYMRKTRKSNYLGTLKFALLPLVYLIIIPETQIDQAKYFQEELKDENFQVF